MPPLTIESARALVGGDVPQQIIDEENRMLQTKPALPKEQKVKVVRSFFHAGKVLEKDSAHTLPYAFAKEMQAANKVVFVEEPKPAPAPEAKKEDPKGVEKAKR